MAKDRKVEYELSLKDEATRIHKQFADSVNKDALSISNAAKGAGAAIGAMFSIGAASQFISKYAEAETQSAKLSQALANVGAGSDEVRKAFDDQAAALSAKTAVDDDEISALQATLVAMTGNVDAAKELTPAVLDLSRGLGISTEAAARMFAKTNEGSEGLKRAGITIGETNNELDRTHKIAQAVKEKWGGMAEAFGRTPEGQMQGIANSLENVQETLGKILFEIIRPMLPAITFISNILQWVMPKAVAFLQLLFVRMWQSIIGPMALVEIGLNKLGITQSTVFQKAIEKSKLMEQAYANQILGIDNATDSTKKNGDQTTQTAAATKLLSENIKVLKDELAKLDPGTKAYIDTLVRLNKAQQEYDSRVYESAMAAKYVNGVILDESEKKFSSLLRGQQQYEIRSEGSIAQSLQRQNAWSQRFAAIDAQNNAKNLQKKSNDLQKSLEFQTDLYSNFSSAVGGTLQNTLGTEFEKLLGNQNSILEKFLGMMGQNLIAWGAAQLAQTILNAITARATSAAATAAQMAEMASLLAVAAPAALAVNIASFGAAGLAAAGSFATAAGAQIAAQGAVSLFHDGGVVGQFGERIPLKSDERHTILRVGETVLPTKPGESIGGGTTIHLQFNNYAPITDMQALHELGNRLMRSMGVNDITKVFRNDNNGIALSAG